MIAAGTAAAARRDAAARVTHEERRRRLRQARDVVHRPRPSSSRSTSCSTPAAAWPAWWRRCSSTHCPTQDADDAVLRGGRHVPEPRSQPAHRGEPPRHHRAGDRREGRHRHRLGRRRRSLLLHRRHRRVHRRRLRHGAARRGVPAQAARRRRSSTTCAPATRSRTRPRSTAATALMNRVGHAFFKRRMREDNAIFGGEVTGHYYFRDNFYADNGFIPALLILELMSRKRQTLRELLDAAAREVLHLRRDQHQGRRHGEGAGEDRRPGGEIPRRARSTRWTAFRPSSRTGTSTSAARTPSRCCG